MTTTALKLVRPFMPFLPGIRKPERKIKFAEKLMWTSAALFVFLICSHVPLFGIMSSESSDPFYWMRAILASNRGTLMELGTSPIISASMIMQVITNSELIIIDHSIKEDQNLFAGTEKLLAIILTFGQAVVQVMTGFYGPPKEIGIGICLLLATQLFIAGIIVLLLDEMLEVGYGLGSGISLFIASNVCESIFWKSFSPTTHITGKGTEFEGAIVGAVHVLFVRKNKLLALKEAFFRSNFPNLSSLITTVGLFMLVAFLQGIRVEIPVIGKTGNRGNYPIPLFYTSNMPIMLQSTLISHIFFISQLLYKKFPKNLFVKLLGIWEPRKHGGMYPESGFCRYILAPESWNDFITDPIRALICSIFFLGISALLSSLWIDVSGMSPKEVAKRLKSQGLTLRGHRDGAIQTELERIIPMAAGIGGFLIALLSIGGDLIGTIGSGTGLLMTVSIIYKYVEIFRNELA
eukprot:GHVP01007606.1.p1 GENE.GHVP01007606.1~~GHVP01007606.1.p1  ORF type:complete len:463 (-),score=63.27 GHVP01007606.1:29-1417(-)